jgi:hypothetical protein
VAVPAPRLMEPPAAAAVLRQKLADPTKPMTVADASAASGLPLRDAEAGLHWLTSEYRGHLRVTEDGDLVHVFPNGFTKPWQTRESAWRAASAVGHGLASAGRFVVRAWLLIAMVLYAAIFVGILIALTFARGSNDRDGGGIGVGLLGGLARALGDALFWTFYFGPSYGTGYYVARERQVSRGRDPNEVPFYEKVNRFVFGPAVPKEDPQATRARIVDEIRAQKGRIGLADVMRVTGLPRDQADPLMARLMLDYEGDVEVAEQGGIIYRFEALRRTAAQPEPAAGAASASTSTPTPSARPPRSAAWDIHGKLPPLTGNEGGADLGIALLNMFNLFAGALVIEYGLTVSNLIMLLRYRPRPGMPPLVLPNDGLPIVLGIVPLVFSLAIFALPLVRSMTRLSAAKKVAQENARLAIMREVLTRAPKKEPVPDEALRVAYRVATGSEPTSKEITARVVELGGDVDVGPAGEVRYRFADLEAEAEALEEEREHAPALEAKLGRVVFASDDEKI